MLEPRKPPPSIRLVPGPEATVYLMVLAALLLAEWVLMRACLCAQWWHLEEHCVVLRSVSHRDGSVTVTYSNQDTGVIGTHVIDEPIADSNQTGQRFVYSPTPKALLLQGRVREVFAHAPVDFFVIGALLLVFLVLTGGVAQRAFLRLALRPPPRFTPTPPPAASPAPPSPPARSAD
jgi:hypothetical protein